MFKITTLLKIKTPYWWFTCLLLISVSSFAENGYDCWLRYKPVANKDILKSYREQTAAFRVFGLSRTMHLASRELSIGLKRLLEQQEVLSIDTGGTVIIGKASSLDKDFSIPAKDLVTAGPEGFIIISQRIKGKKYTIITANEDPGVLYGVFHLLLLMQMEKPIDDLHVVSAPSKKFRLLNHWDNLDGTVERGYAGKSIWNWGTLPEHLDQRYSDYARLNASLGINGTVLNNVNADATVLTPVYLKKVKALADLFRPYGIKVYLTAKFSAPIDIGGLPTADPQDPAVKEWWKQKVAEIYNMIPDFGGFLVKANSEGQPGPQDYGRSHADGANMLADAFSPFKGVVIWRAFVYKADKSVDRHKQAYNDFFPLDGKFKSNVLVQVKNGPIDFMPREPFHPLFGALRKTPVMLELQVTQEYLGHATHLVYLAPLFKECLQSDTYRSGKGTTVASTIEGIAGVANIGSDINWTGHYFAQANWYALGRLSWNTSLSADQIADEWLRMTFINDSVFVKETKMMMMASRNIAVKYMTPLGLHHIMSSGDHYGPAPWVNDQSRADWNPVYYHKADTSGIGFNRTSTGSNALEQYQPEVANTWKDPKKCDDKYLLWFHHLPWDFTMKNGLSLWEELCQQYYSGVDSAKWMTEIWNWQLNKIDEERYETISSQLNIQQAEAKWWRDACLLYFQTFSGLPFPAGYEEPEYPLEHYKKVKLPLDIPEPVEVDTQQ